MDTAKRILVVDDNRELLGLMCTALSRGGYEVHGVSDGAKAAREIDQSHYDLVVLDVVMPHLDGIELSSHFRSSGSNQKFITISGSNSPNCLELTELFGASATLSKPFAMTDLMAAVEATLETAGPPAS